MLRWIPVAALALYRFFASEKNTRVAHLLILLLVAQLLLLSFIDNLERLSNTRVSAFGHAPTLFQEYFRS